jgi:hypothetical protein
MIYSEKLENPVIPGQSHEFLAFPKKKGIDCVFQCF